MANTTRCPAPARNAATASGSVVARSDSSSTSASVSTPIARRSVADSLEQTASASKSNGASLRQACTVCSSRVSVGTSSRIRPCAPPRSLATACMPVSVFPVPHAMITCWRASEVSTALTASRWCGRSSRVGGLSTSADVMRIPLSQSSVWHPSRVAPGVSDTGPVGCGPSRSHATGDAARLRVGNHYR